MVSNPGQLPANASAQAAGELLQRQEVRASALKEVVAELTLENRLLKKSVTADGEEDA